MLGSGCSCSLCASHRQVQVRTQVPVPACGQHRQPESRGGGGRCPNCSCPLSLPGRQSWHAARAQQAPPVSQPPRNEAGLRDSWGCHIRPPGSGIAMGDVTSDPGHTQSGRAAASLMGAAQAPSPWPGDCPHEGQQAGPPCTLCHLPPPMTSPQSGQWEPWGVCEVTTFHSTKTAGQWCCLSPP